MTSKLTRERLQEIAEDGFLKHGESKELARMALAAMDSEPVAYIFKHPAGRLFWSLTDESNKGHDDVMPVYANPQPAPEVPTFDEWLELSGNKPLGWVKDAMRESYDACRSAMLNGGKL